MKLWQFGIAIVLVLGFVATLAVGFGSNPHAVPFVLKDQPAPDFQLRTIGGETLSLSALRGKPVLINFWATWCKPCEVEHDILQIGSRRYPEAHFVGVVYQDSEENVRAYLQQRASHYPQLLDVDSKTAIDYGVAGVPETFIIDAEGIVRHKQVSVVTPDVLQRHLVPLLQK